MSHNKKILYLEVLESVSSVTEAILQSAGYEVMVVRSVAEACSVLDNEDIIAAILTHSTTNPASDVRPLVAELEAKQSLPFIVVVNGAENLFAHVRTVLTKPFLAKDLVAMIEECTITA